MASLQAKTRNMQKDTYTIQAERDMYDFMQDQLYISSSSPLSNISNVIHHSVKKWEVVHCSCQTFDVCPAANNLRIDDKPCACNESGDVLSVTAVAGC